MKDQIEEQGQEVFLNKIIGKRIIGFNRASDMLVVAMGEEIESIDSRGKTIIKSSVALHVQSPWRLVDTNEGKIKLASSDIYIPTEEDEIMDNYEWDEHGKNLFDKRIKEWNGKNKFVYIKNCILGRLGDLKLELSSDEKLEIFINVSGEEECWRLLEHDSEKEHMVVTGRGIHFE